MTTASTSLDHLKDIHSEALSNNRNNDSIALELIEILGGIDNVLSHYFSTADSLNDDQIERLLTTLNNHNTSEIGPKLGNEEKQEYVYNISIEHSVLQWLCPKLNIVRILSFMFNPYVIITLTISGLFWGVLYFTSLRTLTWSLILQSVFLVFITCYFIVVALTANVKITKLIFKTFEFWLKVYYVLSGTILAVIYRYHAGDDYHVSFTYARDYSYQSVGYAALRIVLVVIVITVSLLDAIPPISKRVNAAALITCAIFISIGALYWSSLKVDNDVINIKMFGGNFNFAMVERVASSYRILALFLWKSVFFYLYKRKYAVFVKSPYKTRVKWTGIENGIKKMMSMNALKQMQTMKNNHMAKSIQIGSMSDPDPSNVETAHKQEL